MKTRKLPLALATAAALVLIPAPPAAARGLPESGCTPVFIQSTANRRVVSAEVDYPGGKSGMLRARATSSGGAWERFEVCRGKSHDTIYSPSAKRYVTAEVTYADAEKGMLRARATKVGEWERFDVACAADGVNCTIKSLANDRYVSAELNYSGEGYAMLRARATFVDKYERFQILCLTFCA
ncbi:fascin domain-containing protein [Herbidospora daliensis]|uniref:fascin domain-containing protein n=1 Tax=Herbidospora daliensis TaxID=295585 RepID=UPI0007846F01|nr:hypothetical protein [Herbidospora daliensis]